MSGQTIVVIEDEATIAGAIAVRLRSEGFRVEVAGSGPDGVQLCHVAAPDLVVLDWMLPGFDGIEACRRIQADRPVPVLFLTARDAEADVLVGLGIGADDYVTKPFSPRELVARVHAVLRRAARGAAAAEAISPIAAAAAPITLGDGAFVLDREARRVTAAGGREVRLTPTELDLLATLAARPGRAFSRRELLAEVWDWRSGGSTRTVDSHVAALRRKLGPGIVRTVHGHGYALGDAP
jgi:DNA-binding response OmpR family regulator